MTQLAVKSNQNETARNGADVTEVIELLRMKNSRLLQDWATHMYAEGKAKRTVKDRLITLNRLEQDLQRPALLAETHEIAEWLARDELSAVTRSVYHSILSMFYRHVVDAGLRDDNPMLRIRAAKRPKRQPRPVTQTQYERLRDTASTKELKAMVLLGSLLGLRDAEIARFNGRQIDPEARIVDVTGKGGTQALLPVHRDLIEHAKLMPTGYWFPSQRGRHIGGRTVWQHLRLHMIVQRVPGTPHCLRHYFGTTLVENGADLRVAQELLRHSSLQTTAIYVKTSDQRKRAAIDSFPEAS